MEQQYDVAIIGYGPTGVTAANMLGARGLSVLVVERDTEIYSRARAISTDEEVVRIWQGIGLADRLVEDMLPERPIAFVDDRQRSFVDAHPRSHGHGFPPQLFIYQPALEQVLRDGVDRYPNVDVRLEHECVRLAQEPDGVELMLIDLADDELHRVRASWVIAADGGSSPTRGSLGIGFDGTTYEDRWVVIDTKVKKEWPNHDHLRFHCDPDRPAVDCPTPLGHHRWEFPIRPGEDEEALVSDEGVWALLGSHGITDEHVAILRAVVYSHHVRFASKWRRGRIFLAGDAAHVMPPWLGQGMAAGVRDAANLCWKLAGVVDGSLPESVLDSYEAERQPHVRCITRRAVSVGRIICEKQSLLARVRNVAFRLLNRLPTVANSVQVMLWVPAARYAQGFRAGTGHAAEGHKPPQPWLATPAGDRIRLDDAAGPSWAVVHLGPEPAEAVAWREAGATVIGISTESGHDGRHFTDIDGSLVAWMRGRRARAIVLRPDRFVYAAARAGELLPGPLVTADATSAA